MPFEIIRQDITKVRADAIVNTSSVMPGIGSGVDSAIHKAAGPQLLAARKKLGIILPGEAALSPAYRLNAKYVIHTVSPRWKGGDRGEAALLKSCYENALRLAVKAGCGSVAFPLLSAGNLMVPPRVSMQAALSVFADFLLEEDIHIYLTVFDREAFDLSEKLLSSVKNYVDDQYIAEKLAEEYPLGRPRGRFADRENFSLSGRFSSLLSRGAEEDAFEEYEADAVECRTESADSFSFLLEDAVFEAPATGRAEETTSYLPPVIFDIGPEDDALGRWLAKGERGFSETLLGLIDLRGETESAVYRRANVDRKLFSKIRKDPDYHPKKSTALAFALALRLDLDQTRSLLEKAGYALTRSSKADLVVEYFILHRNYDIFQLNEVLFYYDLPLIGG